MTPGPVVDGVLVQWGERLFYPSNRSVKSAPTPRLDTMTRRKAAVMRQRIRATVSGRVPQVMVKVTGGGRGMAAITAHFQYISKNGRLQVEDDRGIVREGKEAVRDLADQWRYGGSLIEDVGHRREAFNIMLSMPHGTSAQFVQIAAREFAQTELAGHRYVMVLHEHQANPHVHLSVRAESTTGTRLNPRKSDLHRWRETFAEKLRGWGIEAEATRQATRGAVQNFDPLWRVKARQEGRLRQTGAASKSGDSQRTSRVEAIKAWAHIIKALNDSERPEDRALAKDVARFVQGTAFLKEAERLRGGQVAVTARQQADRQQQPMRKPMDERGPQLDR